MKTIIASAIVALSFAAPAAAADVSVKKFFALGNDSAAERIVGDTSQGNISLAQGVGAWANESAAERQVATTADIATRDASLISFFSMSNESAAEIK